MSKATQRGGGKPFDTTTSSGGSSSTSSSSEEEEVMQTQEEKKSPLDDRKRAASSSKRPRLSALPTEEEEPPVPASQTDSRRNSETGSSASAPPNAHLSAEALAHIRQRNALYSKRKYYKRKQEVQRLERQRYELQIHNAKLRNENDRLELLLASVKRQIDQSPSSLLMKHIPAASRYSQEPVRSATSLGLGLADDTTWQQHLLHDTNPQFTTAALLSRGGALQHLPIPPQASSLPIPPQASSLPNGNLLEHHPRLTLPNDVRMMMGSNPAANPSDLVRLLGGSTTAFSAQNDPVASLLLEQYLAGGDSLRSSSSLPLNFREPNWMHHLPNVPPSASSPFMSANHRTEQQQLILELLQQQRQTDIPQVNNEDAAPLLRFLQQTKQPQRRPSLPSTANARELLLLRQWLEQQERTPPL